MCDMNELSVRYYLKDLERTASHDITTSKHRERSTSFLSVIVNLMRVVGGAFSPFEEKRPSRSKE